MRRDFGAGRVLGLETRSAEVEEALRVHLLEPHEITTGDFWEHFSHSAIRPVNAIFVLVVPAPERLPLERMWGLAEEHLVGGGQLVVVAQDREVLAIPTRMLEGPAMEGIMKWFVSTRSRVLAGL